MVCRALTGDKMVITPKGFVYPCVALKSLHFPCEFNNIHKYKLTDIMNVFKEILKPLKDANCQECPAQALIRCLTCQNYPKKRGRLWKLVQTVVKLVKR